MVLKRKEMRKKGFVKDFEDIENFEDDESLLNEPIDIDDDFLLDDDESFNDLETGFDQNAKIQQIWLDANPYINNLYLAITNKEIKKKKIKLRNGEETIKTEIRQIEGTEPLANSLGVSQLMGFIKGIFAKDIVMGNVDRKQYDNFMYFFSLDLMKMLLVNRITWNIKVNDVDIIHSIITNGANFYLTRPIQDGERRSSRGRPELPMEEKPKGFMDRIVSRYKSNQGRV